MQSVGYEFSSPRTSKTRMLATACYVALVITVSAASIALALSTISGRQAVGSGQYECITVQPGDTLWALARERSGPETDLRRAVYEIRALNGLVNAELYPGQQLLLP